MAVLLRNDGGQSIVRTGCNAVVAFRGNLIKVSSEPKSIVGTKNQTHRRD